MHKETAERYKLIRKMHGYFCDARLHVEKFSLEQLEALTNDTIGFLCDIEIVSEFCMFLHTNTRRTKNQLIYEKRIDYLDKVFKEMIDMLSVLVYRRDVIKFLGYIKISDN